MSKRFFITFEGTEGGGKSTQIQMLAWRLRSTGLTCRVLREPGGTPIGEELRHTLKHSAQNHAMTPETELLLMNASRAQLVREVIRPALEAGEVVVCDRYYDSTVAYQAYGRQLDLGFTRQVIHFAVGETRPVLTLLLMVPVEVSEQRRLSRQQAMRFNVPAPQPEPTLPSGEPLRDRMEEADRPFFLRVEEGYRAIAAAEPDRVKVIDATRSIEVVHEAIWSLVQLRINP